MTQGKAAGGGRAFRCGHPRDAENEYWFKNGSGRSSRCRQCHFSDQTQRQRAGRGALKLVLRLHAEGTLTEGQVSSATGLDRVEIRRLSDEAA